MQYSVYKSAPIKHQLPQQNHGCRRNRKRKQISRQQDLYASVAAAWNSSWLSLTASTDLRWSDLTTDVYRSA